MLASKYKIRDREIFDELKSKGKKITKPDFLFVYLEDESLKESKFGIIVTKKINNKAVIRNRIKRVIYAALEKEIDKLERNIYGLFVVRRDISEMKSKEFQEDVDKIFKFL